MMHQKPHVPPLRCNGAKKKVYAELNNLIKDNFVMSIYNRVNIIKKQNAETFEKIFLELGIT